MKLYILTSRFFTILSLLLLLTSYSYAGTYADSAHGNTTSGVKTRTTGFETGNCAHCHDQHASRVNSTHTPNDYTTGLSEENLCLDCHDNGPATDNISTQLIKTYIHDVTAESGKHRFGETKTEMSVFANKHVECTDCHNPHTGDSTKRAQGVNTIGTNSPLYGVSGVEISAWNTNWTAPTYSANYKSTAAYEYEICFKCHSGANSNYSSWGGSGAASWTDVGLEFSPNNQSFHPIVQALDVGDQLDATAQLDGGWSPGDTMYCSDCHESDSGAAGPHGSAVKWMLAGTNKAWPYTSASNNGTSSGTYFTLSARSTNLGTTNGLFCRNCHDVIYSSCGTSCNDHVHFENNDHNVACVYCHIRVPHGGKVDRLIATTNVPARYRADGDGNGTLSIVKFKKAASYNSYNRYGDCWTSCSRHTVTDVVDGTKSVAW